MRVREYAASIGLDSDDILRAVEDVNAGLPASDQITATSHASGLDDREIGLLNKFFGKGDPEPEDPQQDSQDVDSEFGFDGEMEADDELLHADEVDTAFAESSAKRDVKEIPMRQYACWGRKNRGKGPPEVKRVVDANDESEAINRICQALTLNPSDYKFNVKKMKDLPPRIVRGVPLKNARTA